MADNDKSGRTPEQIRHDIEATRDRMGQTLGALEYRLDPDRLKQEAKSTIREKTIGRVEQLAGDAGDSLKGASEDVFDTIKNNPLPAALAAIGLGWLFMESRNNRRQMSQEGGFYNEQDYPAPRRYRTPQRYDPYNRYGTYESRYGTSDWNEQETGGSGPVDRVRTATSHAADRVQDAASSAAGTVQDAASSAAGTVQDVAGQVADKAQDFAGQAQDQMGEWADTAQQAAYRVRSRFEQMLDENPLLVGAAAVALGAAIGMSVPSTSKEDELFGERRDQLLDKAQDVAQDTMQKVQNVAERTADVAKDTARDEAQKQGLSQS